MEHSEVIALTADQTKDLDILVKSLIHLRTFFTEKSNQQKYLLNGCIVDKTHQLFDRRWTPAAFCMKLADSIVPSLLGLSPIKRHHNSQTAYAVKRCLADHDFSLILEEFPQLGLPSRFVLSCETFTWILNKQNR